MAISRMIFGMIMTLACARALAEALTLQSPLPLLSIGDRGELMHDKDDEFSFTPWRSDHNPGKVHVVQYFGANMGDSEIFEPFTDLLQESLEPDVYHVTTILNLDAAMWGTSGWVVSEVKKSKRKHPDATIVLDEEGTGVVEWQLGDEGNGLIVLDDKGIVRYFSKQALSAEEMRSTLALVRSNIDG